MDSHAAPDDPNDAPVLPAAPDLLAQRIDGYRVEATTSFRALQGLACQIATILEQGGSRAELQALADAFLRTEHRAGAELVCLGAALDSCGTA